MQGSMISAVPPKADMCSTQADVRYVPIADKIRTKADISRFRLFTMLLPPNGRPPLLSWIRHGLTPISVSGSVN
jgi:hypothetical protein